ncbi:MAG: class I SAM-dependent methyltransferase [Pseudomonadota bacterium]
MATLYDTIGKGYRQRRNPDPSIARMILSALDDAESVLNVGAGTGSYEPRDRDTIALEPSSEMLRQRHPQAAPAIRGIAEALPFADNSFDVVMGVLTIHHWTDPVLGLREMQRVARDKTLLLTFDAQGPYFWLKDYIPGIVELDQPRMPNMSLFAEIWGDVSIKPVPIPHDCVDGFLGAYWRRPTAYLDPSIRASMSTFPKLGDVSPEISRLMTDLENGAWHERYRDILSLEALDIGYRLVVAKSAKRL